MASPYFDDLDLNFSELIKARAENVLILPSGLDEDAAGYIVSFDEKLYIWTGTKWNTWGKEGVTDEIDASLDSSTPPAESDIFTVKSTFIHDHTSHIHAFYVLGFDDYAPRTLGTLHFLGSNTPPDWDKLGNAEFTLTAADGCWFNIKDNSAEILPSDTKPIKTGYGTDVNGVTKAKFAYYAPGYWMLVSYELKDFSYFQRFVINPMESNESNTIPKVYTFPNMANTGLPYEGYYSVDVFIEFDEYKADGISRANVVAPQILDIQGTSGGYFKIDKSPFYNAGIMSPTTELYNSSLQGSAIVLVEGDCQDRLISTRLTLPNGLFRKVFGGYAHIKYLGPTPGTNCIKTKK